MNKLLILIVLIIIISCQQEVIIKEEESIENIKLSLSINDDSQNIIVYHIYLKHCSENDKSLALNHFDLINDINVSLFPGIYNVYAYGLIEKTETSKMVFSYSIIENIEFFKDKDIKLVFNILYPDAKIEYDKLNNKVYLKVYMNELFGIFSLSSLSLKQGNDRVRSLDFQKKDKFYIAEVPLFENGEWFMNISYLLLTSKKDSNVLERDNISISTSYFKDILLGEFNFL